MRDDVYFMQRAIELARKGAGRTHPNPPVGAVLKKNGRIIGEGYHRRAGGDHAEVVAIKAAGSKALGATLYVTLEPCSTQGKTGPCTEAIIAAGIEAVVVSVKDPNPLHRGKGLKTLRQTGIDVTVGVCADEGQMLIESFSRWILTGLPFVTLKLGMTIDGKIADSTGTSQWITGPKSRARVQSMRKKADAVMVGARTALLDDPSLLCTGRRDGSLLRLIIDSKGNLPLASTVLNDSCSGATVVVTTRQCADSRINKYKEKGVSVWTLPSARGHVSIPALVRKLGKEGLMNVLCEGGGELAYALIKAGMVNEFYFFMAPKIMGGVLSVPSVGGQGWKLGVLPELKFVGMESCGDDIVLTARPLTKE